MALPVAQIMAQLQGRGRGGDEEGMVDDEEERLGAEVASEELERSRMATLRTLNWTL